MIKQILSQLNNEEIHPISGFDAVFIYGESPTSHMHIGSVVIIDGNLDYEDFKKVVASRIHMIPKLRKRLVQVPMSIDYPYWVDDPNFDLDLHLNRMKLPDPSNWKTLRYLTSKLFSASLDLRRPLWSIHFIEGIDEIAQVPKGSVAIVTKVHHVMIDGRSGVGVMDVLFDSDKDGKEKKRAKPKAFNPEPLPDELSLLLKSGYSFLKNPFKIPKTVAETTYSFIKSQATRRLSIQKEFSSSKFPVPITIFNGSISAKRTWGTAILSFDRVNGLRKTIGGSFNDIILAICSGAIRRYLLEKEKLPIHPVVANVPISIRSENNTEMNNQIANMMIQIATHIEDPLERLEYIQEQTMLGKSRHNKLGAKTLSKMADAVPFGVANLIAGLYSKYNIKDLHRPPFNVTITNVPGPSGLLYLNGHKVVSIFTLTPVVDGFGLIISAFSYNGQVSITTTSDSKTMPDTDLFSRYIRESANELESLIQNSQKDDSSTKSSKKQEKSKSTLMFRTLKKYLKANPKQVKAHKGVYYIEVGLGDKTEGWEIDLTKATAVIKKKKNVNPKLLVEIEDDSLYALYKGKLLLDELDIQGRIKLTGTAANKTKFLNLLTAFLER